MKPQSSAFLEKSEELLERAEAMLRIRLTEDAGRSAYLAGFHAAQAAIFEVHDRVLKTHASVRGEFGRLIKDDIGLDQDLRTFLGRAYNFKAVADYETGPGGKITENQAAEAISAAHRFVAYVATLLGRSG